MKINMYTKKKSGISHFLSQATVDTYTADNRFHDKANSSWSEA